MAGETFPFTSPAVARTKPADLAKQWDSLGFQIRPLNGYMKYTWKDGAWDQGEFVPAPYILLHINSGALHYGVSCFEGLKAFTCKDGTVRLLNPTLNAKRMQEGARKLRMPEVPTDLFIRGAGETVRRNVEFVPPYGHAASLYIRPLLFASGQMLGLAPLADEYVFLVTATPAGGLYDPVRPGGLQHEGRPGYFGKSVGEEGLDALVIEDFDRAAPRGTGNVKAAGNYAADLEPLHMAKEKGFATTLYLDAKERRYVEEFSVANFVGITKEGKYVTPFTESILQSNTNRMLQQLARDEGIEVEQRPVDFDAEIGDFREVGMVGTAAVVARVRSITRGDRVHEFGPFDVLARLRARLQAIQNGDAPDAHGWLVDVCPARSLL